MNQVEIPEGARVAYRHLRPTVDSKRPPEDGTLLLTARDAKERGWPVKPKGGITFATVLRNQVVLAEGTAVCRPDENFSRKLGRNIALGRALKTLQGGKYGQE